MVNDSDFNGLLSIIQYCITLICGGLDIFLKTHQELIERYILLRKKMKSFCALLVGFFALSSCSRVEDVPEPTAYEVRLPYRAANGLHGYINSENKLVIPAIYSAVEPFSEGRALVYGKEGGSSGWGYIDEQGSWIVKPRFTSGKSFHNGEAMAYVYHRGTRSHFIDLNPFSHDGYTIAYRIDLSGKILEKWNKTKRGYISPKKLAEIKRQDRDRKKRANKNRKKIEPIYQGFAFELRYSDYIAVQMINYPAKGSGIINRKGQVVVPFGAYQHFDISVNEFFIARLEKQKWGILNAEKNTVVIPFEYSSRADLKVLDMGSSSPVLAVRDQAQRWTLFDTSGKRICGNFYYVEGAHENVVAIRDEAGSWGAVNTEGVWVTEPRYQNNFGPKFKHGVAEVWLEVPESEDVREERVKRRLEYEPYKISFYIDKNGRELRANSNAARLAGVSCN